MTKTLKQTIASIACAATFLTLAGASARAADAGVANFTFNAAHRDMPVQALIWYPAQSGGFPEEVGDDPVFQGTPARRGAVPEPGKHQLVVLSHGAGGNAANLGWLSARLVHEGYIVAAPNHPGSTSGDSRPETNIKGWERPQDVTALLDAIAASKGLQRLVDVNNVTAMGFSMGGYTALALGGARVAASDYAKYCDDHAAAMDCAWFDHGNDYIKGHVDLRKVDAAAFGTSYEDVRVTRVVAIDPGFAQAYVKDSLAKMSVPAFVLNLGTGQKIPLGVEGGRIAAAIPHATYATVDGANHFTFLGLCKTFGWVFLMMEGDDPVCTEVSERRRSGMHDEIAEKIIGFLAAPVTN